MKRFILRFLLMAAPFMLLYPYPMWKYMQGECYGDLNVLGTDFFDVKYRKVYEYFDQTLNLARQTEDICADMQVLSADSTVLIIGDSFSQLGTRSFLCYLQHEMPSWNIINIRTLPDGNDWKYVHKSCCGNDERLLFHEMTDVITYLLKFAEYLPKTIIIESGEMLFVERMLQTRMDINDEMLPRFTEATDARLALTQQNKPAFAYSQNPEEAFDYANRWVRKLVGMGRRTLHQKLDRAYFTCQGHENDLFFYSKHVQSINSDDFVRMQNVKDTLLQLAERRNVKLIFLMCPDKFDMYRNHIVNMNPKYNVPSLFEMIGDDDSFFPTKSFLLEHLDHGVKDLYFCNDTHWSHIASSIVAQKLKEHLISSNNTINANMQNK